MAEQTHALARLIVEYKQRTGESFATIAARAGLPKATVAAWVTNPVLSLPKPENLEKLACGLRLDLATVTRAAQEAAGYHVAETRTTRGARLLIGQYERLTPSEQASVAALVEHLLKQHRQADQ